MTVAPEGSHWETKASGAGSRGGAMAPPEELLPSTTKNSQVGTIAHRPISTAISSAKEATAVICSARMPQLSPVGRGIRCSSAPSRTVTISDAAAARPTMRMIFCRRGNRPAFARTWKTVVNPTIVTTSMR
jgi:hypothetical protein